MIKTFQRLVDLNHDLIIKNCKGETKDEIYKIVKTNSGGCYNTLRYELEHFYIQLEDDLYYNLDDINDLFGKLDMEY